MPEESEPPTPDKDTTEEDEVLKKRFYSGTILARMLYLIMQLLHDGAYQRGRKEHIIATTRVLYIMILIMINDHRKHRPPLSPTVIEGMTGISRKSVTRYLEQLEERGMVKRRIESRKIDGYVTNPDFFKSNLRANYFRRIVRIIHIASGMLLKLMS